MNSCLVMLKNSEGYSGGRYCAILFCIALVKQGYKVTVLTNKIPTFLSDFKSYHELKKITFDETLYNFRKKKYKADHIIVFPDLNPFSSLYESAVIIANENNSTLIMHSFETPNWFNAHTKKKRKFFLWSGWNFLSKYASSIITMTKIGVRYAIDHYNKKEVYCAYPSINENIANNFFELKKNKEIFVIARFGKFQDHKGGEQILNLFDVKFSTYTFILFGNLPVEIKSEVNRRAKLASIEVKFINNVSDEKKFELLSRCECQIFLSSFEGYGYPPIESAYVGTPSIIYPLDVFKETIGSSAFYIDDINQIKKKYDEYINQYDAEETRDKIIEKTSLDSYSKRIDYIIKRSKSINNLSFLETVLVHFRYALMCFINKINELRK